MRLHDGLSSFLGVLEFYYFQSIVTLHSLSDLVCTGLTYSLVNDCVFGIVLGLFSVDIQHFVCQLVL